MENWALNCYFSEYRKLRDERSQIEKHLIEKLCTRAYESLIPPEFEIKDPTLELFLDH